MLQVVSLGQIVQDPACYAVLTGKPVVYPDHYTVRRAVFVTPSTPAKPTLLYKDTSAKASAAALAAMEHPYFTASIAVSSSATAGKTLHFTLTRSDNPTGKVYTGDKLATSVWRAALEAAAADFPDRKGQLLTPYDAKGRLQVNGARLFGLHLKEIQEELMALPGGAAAFESAAATLLQVSPSASQPAPTITTTTPAGGKLASCKQPSGDDPADIDATLLNKNNNQSSGNITVTPILDQTRRSSSKLPSVVAVTAVKAKRTLKPNTETTALQIPNASSVGFSAVDRADVSAVASTKRRRASVKKSTSVSNTNGDSVAPALTAAASAPTSFVVCPDCGLAGTPFCAATGKPHEVAPCAVCGLRTAFCPVSGQPHAGAIQRENRQRGEVHLPSTTRRPRQRNTGAKATPQHQQLSDSMSAAGTSQNGDVVEVTLVSTQDGSGTLAMTVEGDGTIKKPRRKRMRTMPEDDAALPAAAAVDGSSSVSVPAKRDRKPKKAEPAATTATAASSATPEAERSLFELAKESIYIYPPLRPPLSNREHHKAAQLMQEKWKAQYGDGPVLPPAVAAVPLAFVPAKRIAAGPGTAAAATTTKDRRKGRGRAAVKEEGDRNNNDANEDIALNTDERKDGVVEKSANADAQGRVALDGADWEMNEGAHHNSDHKDNVDGYKSVLSNAVGSPTAFVTPSTLPSMVHPLEVTQLSTSVAGKRLTKFLLQYASERSQLDLLRSHAVTTVAGSGSAEKKKLTQAREQLGSTGGADGGGDALLRAHANAENAASPAAASPTHTEDIKSEVVEEEGEEVMEGGEIVAGDATSGEEGESVLNEDRLAYTAGGVVEGDVAEEGEGSGVLNV